MRNISQKQVTFNNGLSLTNFRFWNGAELNVAYNVPFLISTNKRKCVHKHITNLTLNLQNSSANCESIRRFKCNLPRQAESAVPNQVKRCIFHVLYLATRFDV